MWVSFVVLLPGPTPFAEIGFEGFCRALDSEPDGLIYSSFARFSAYRWMKLMIPFINWWQRLVSSGS